jgi:hypothetical protein
VIAIVTPRNTIIAVQVNATRNAKRAAAARKRAKKRRSGTPSVA